MVTARKRVMIVSLICAAVWLLVLFLSVFDLFGYRHLHVGSWSSLASLLLYNTLIPLAVAAVGVALLAFRRTALSILTFVLFAVALLFGYIQTGAHFMTVPTVYSGASDVHQYGEYDGCVEQRLKEVDALLPEGEPEQYYYWYWDSFSPLYFSVACFDFDTQEQYQAQIKRLSAYQIEPNAQQSVTKKLDSGDELSVLFNEDERKIVVCCCTPTVKALMPSSWAEYAATQYGDAFIREQYAAR